MIHDTPASHLPRPLHMTGLWSRAVLIGTPETLPPLIEQLAALTDYPAPIGCLLPTHEGQTRIEGLPVLGTIDLLAGLHHAQPLTLGIVSLPDSMHSLILRVRSRLRGLGVVERFVTPLSEMLDAPPATAVRAGAIDMVELIGRTPYGIDRRSVAGVLENKAVLVTGAGGSIGSEIVRIAGTFRPAKLILMDRSENALFEIDRAVARLFPDTPRKAVLHDIVDEPATRRLFDELRPHTVFHAAAHKHVPLMEDHPGHAVGNNLLGTRSVADAAVARGCERFVMISSDKAVNPTSVMGATKRLAELYIQDLSRHSSTRFSMVRFGNVLGSACSVLPIWTTQLAEGGPLTVTDARMTRYFMTIHEAATLVIQSAAIDSPAGAPAPVYVLDMGEPVRILDLARRFVALNGFEPRLVPQTAQPAAEPSARPSMEIVFTGARPGEKLAEELAYAMETLSQSPYPGIRAWRGNPPVGFDALRMVENLSVVRHEPGNLVVAAIRKFLPELPAVTHEPRPTGSSAVQSHDKHGVGRVRAA